MELEFLNDNRTCLTLVHRTFNLLFRFLARTFFDGTNISNPTCAVRTVVRVTSPSKNDRSIDAVKLSSAVMRVALLEKLSPLYLTQLGTFRVLGTKEVILPILT
jgi:hypothetical protein